MQYPVQDFNDRFILKLHVFLLIVADISDNTKKCCSACFTRLTRKIAQLTDGSPPVIKTESVEQAVNSVAWSEEEIEMLRSCLKASGRNWAVISQKLHGAKTTEQCKKFFYNNRKKHQLDKLVTEFKRVSFFSFFFLLFFLWQLLRHLQQSA